MPDSPFLETGEYGSQTIPVRGRIHDGAGVYDYTVSGPIEAYGNRNNDNDPVNMRGQTGIGVIFEASKTASITLYAAEKNPAGGWFYYKLYDPVLSIAGNIITKTLTITEDPDTWCTFFAHITAPYVVVRINNDAASDNNVYVRIF